MSACPSESRTKNHKPKFKSHPRLARTLHTSTCPLHTPLVQNGTVTLRPLSAAPHCGQSMWRTSISFRAARSNCRRNTVIHGGIEMFLQSPRLRGAWTDWTHRMDVHADSQFNIYPSAIECLREARLLLSVADALARWAQRWARHDDDTRKSSGGLVAMALKSAPHRPPGNLPGRDARDHPSS